MKRRYINFSVSSCKDVSSAEISILPTTFHVSPTVLTFSVQQQDNVGAKSLVAVSVRRKNFDYLVGQRRKLIGDEGWVVSSHHELFIENEQNPDNRVMIRIIHIIRDLFDDVKQISNKLIIHVS